MCHKRQNTLVVRASRIYPSLDTSKEHETDQSSANDKLSNWKPTKEGNCTNWPTVNIRAIPRVSDVSDSLGFLPSQRLPQCIPCFPGFLQGMFSVGEMALFHSLSLISKPMLTSQCNQASLTIQRTIRVNSAGEVYCAPSWVGKQEAHCSVPTMLC